MKRILYFLILALVIGACSSSRTLMQKGHYDKAIDKSVKKLKKNSTKQKEILVLEQSYSKAMEDDSSKIIFLKKEGRPDNWEEILNVYKKMNLRQNKVKALPKLRVKDRNNVQIRIVDFRIQSFDDQIIQSKEKAAEYFYAHGKSLLEKGGRENAREAYSEFKKIKDLYPDYRDNNELMAKAKEDGTSYVLLKVRNQTQTVIPKDLEDDLLKISPSGMNDPWIRYYTAESKDVPYDFWVLINLKHIDVTPESVKETKYGESRDVQNGWQYAYDSKGNVMKDTSGNDIKIPKMMTIYCEVIETIQLKTARITGSLDFVDASNQTVLKSFPMVADSKFENFSAVPIGNPDALSLESRKRLGGKPMPFPNNMDMIYRAGEDLKGTAKNIVVNNDKILR